MCCIESAHVQKPWAHNQLRAFWIDQRPWTPVARVTQEAKQNHSSPAGAHFQRKVLAIFWEAPPSPPPSGAIWVTGTVRGVSMGAATVVAEGRWAGRLGYGQRGAVRHRPTLPPPPPGLLGLCTTLAEMQDFIYWHAIGMPPPPPEGSANTYRSDKLPGGGGVAGPNCKHIRVGHTVP